jgi:hypothetical protein
MKAGLIFCIVLAVVALSVPSWGEGWKKSIDASLMLGENAYSDNWAGGEAGSISWASNLNGLAEKQLSGKIANKNTLKLAFGQTHNQDKDTGIWGVPAKSTDLVDFESMLLFTLGLFAEPFASDRVESQFFDASDPTLNRYLNPMTLTESAGLSKAIMKQEKREWTARLGAGLRQHLDRDVLIDPLTEKRENKTTNDGGLEFVHEFKTPLAQERITLSNKLVVFEALFYSEADKLKGLPDENYWKAPDVNWENIFAGSVTKNIMVNLYTQLLYDKEIDLGARFKQTLSLGVTYKMI